MSERPERLLSTGEAAKALGLNRRTLSHYAKTGQLRPTLIMPSGHYRWDVEDIRQQLREIRRQRTGGE